MAGLNSGFNIHVLFSQDPSLNLCCTNVQDPGVDIGDPIDITTNCTVGAIEKAAPDLGDTTDLTITAKYDPADRSKLQAILGVAGDVTVEYRACKSNTVGQKITYKGAWLRSYTPQDMERTSMPTIQLVVSLPGGTSSGDVSSFKPEGEWSGLS